MLVDSSALIPLSRVGRLDILKELFGRVQTTRDVYRECVQEGAARPGTEVLARALEDWIEVVETPRGARRVAAAEGVEPADASLLLACERSGAELLSNDAHLLRVGRARGVRGRWLTWLVLEAARRDVLTRPEARDLLGELVREGMRLSPHVFAAVVAALEAMDDGPSGKGRR